MHLDLIVPGPHLAKIGLLMLTHPGQQVQHVQIQMGMLRAKASLSEREDMRACLGDVAVRAFVFQHSADTFLRPALSQTVNGKAVVGCFDRLDIHPQGIVGCLRASFQVDRHPIGQRSCEIQWLSSLQLRQQNLLEYLVSGCFLFSPLGSSTAAAAGAADAPGAAAAA